MKKFLVAITLFLIAAFPVLAQTVPLGPRFVLPYQTVVDGTGTPIPGALLYFYSSGTNIPLSTYSNPLLTTPNSNPVQANAAGVFPAIFLSGNYKIVLTDASNNQIWAADPVYGVGTGGSTGSCLSITVNPQTGTSYTLQPSDNCKLVTFNNSSAIAVSLPSPATNASYQTWSATVSDIGTGTITVTPTGASFTGTGSGTNLTVTGVAGTIATGFLVTGTGVPASTTIVSQSSGTPGGAGVYVTSQATTSSGASLTAAAAINGAATLTVLPGQASQIISDGSNYQVILSSPAGSSISVGSTVVLNGTAGRILYQNGAVIGQYPTTGTAGSVVLSTSPTIVGPTITGSLTATGLVTNADLVNPSVTVNGTACVLGASCTISSSATAVTVSGGSATTILGGSGAGHVILDNAGVLGEVSSTVTVNGTACTLGSTCAPSSAATSITVGTTTVVSGSANALLAQSTSGATVAEITTGNNQTLITNGSGVSSFSATLPTAVQGNITSTGTLTGGATGAGFTIALTTSTVTGINVVTNGGTGLATLTAGAIYKGAGTSVVAVSALSDNGTIVSSSESFDLTSHAAISEIANASSTGTTVNKLAKLSGAPSTALISATTDTGGIVGVVIGGAGTTGNAQIAVSGQATCVFDGGTTAGDYVQNSGSVAGDCTDAGSTYPSSNQVIGRVLATIGSAGNAAIVVFPPEIEASTGGGGGSGTVTSVTLIAGTGMQVSGPCTSTTAISCTLNTPWSITGANIYNNNAGNVGIGTSSPGFLLTVNGNAAATAFVLNSTNNDELYYPGVAPTPGGGNTSLVGINEAGTNIAGSNPPSPILDLNNNNAYYEFGRHFATLDSDWLIRQNLLTQESFNDQTQPTTAVQSIGIGGTWSNGDIASFKVTWTGSGGGNTTLSCTVGTSCNGAWGSGTGTNIVCGYFGDQFNTNATLIAAAIYTDPNECVANFPSAGLNGFPFLLSAFYSGTVTFTNLSTTGSGTMTLHGSSAGDPLDGPTGIELIRTRPTGSSRAPQPGDVVASISMLGNTTLTPNAGQTLGDIATFLTVDPAGGSNYNTGTMAFYTGCPAAGSNSACLRAIIDGTAGGVTVGSPTSITANLGHELEVWTSATHGSEILSVTGNTDETSSVTVLSENQSGASQNLEIRGSTVFAYGTVGNGACQWSGTGTNWSCSSDARIKKAFQPIGNALEKLGQLHPVSFELRRDTSGARHDGFTAQDVQRVFPELVTRTDHKDALTPDGELSLEYTGLIAPTVAAVQQLASEVKTLRAEVQEMKGRKR